MDLEENGREVMSWHRMRISEYGNETSVCTSMK
jgi:hypothetical protein